MSLSIRWMLLFTLMLTVSPLAHTADSVDNKKDDPNKLTFTDKIKTIRSVGGEYDVIFNEHFGPYSVPYSLPQSKNKDTTPEEQLRTALKQGASITVTVNPISETLISIDSDISARTPASKDTDSDETLPPELKDYEDLLKNFNKTKN